MRFARALMVVAVCLPIPCLEGTARSGPALPGGFDPSLVPLAGQAGRLKAQFVLEQAQSRVRAGRPLPAPGDLTFAITTVDLVLRPEFQDTPPASSLAVRVHMTIEGRAASTSSAVFLLDDFTIEGVTDGAGNLEHAFAHDPAGGPGTLTVTLREPLTAGMQADLTIAYHGVPRCKTDPVAGYAGCRLERTLSHLHGTTVFPRKIPASEADDRDIFALTVEVVLPEGLHAAVAAEFDGEFDGPSNTITSKWHNDQTGTIAVAFGEYNVGATSYPASGGLTYSVGSFTQLTTNENAAGYRDIAGDALGWFSARFGPYPQPWFGFAEIASSTPVVVTVPMLGLIPQAFLEYEPDKFGAVGAIAHATSGQWWGRAVKPSGPEDRWFSEALTEFSSLGFESHKYASPVPHYLTLVKHLYQWFYEYGVRPDRDVALASSALADLDWTTYAILASMKGAMVALQLEAILGTKFYPALEGFLGAFPQGRATTEDLRVALEGAHGSSLLWYFDEWVHGIGFPVYTLAWDVQPGGLLYRVDISLRQDVATGGTTFDMPVEFGVYAGGGSEATRIVRRASDVEESYSVSVGERPVSVVMDPEGKLPLKRVISALDGDVDIDMEVDGRDLMIAAWSYGSTFSDFSSGRDLRFLAYTDLNRDGLVDDVDVDRVINNFGACALSECGDR
ncbi:MAG: hypothetical protein HY897_01275 [Deltaproteobacteria bacterium]|nr:hypothetical protein [Deltaproteobacteria bacterium]